MSVGVHFLNDRGSVTAMSLRIGREVDPSTQAFEVRKLHIIASGQASQLQAVAAMLSVISIENEREGRDPDLICDALQCVAATSPVNIDARVLDRNLKRLERLGVVLCEPGGSIRVLSEVHLARIAGDARIDAGTGMMPDPNIRQS